MPCLLSSLALGATDSMQLKPIVIVYEVEKGMHLKKLKC